MRPHTLACLRLVLPAVLWPVVSQAWAAESQPSTSSHPTARRAAPNVILFLTDDQGWADLGCHGNPYARTPQMDSFVRGAVEMDRFYVSPVCAPTRASVMTGRYNFRTGVTDVFDTAAQMDPREVTLAQMMRRGGYKTGIFGKWHLGDDGPLAPNARGFDEALVFRGAAMRPEQYFDPKLLHNGVEKPYKGYCMDVYTDAAIEFMRDNRSRPFFVYLPTNLIHTPLTVADELRDRFKSAAISNKTAGICGMLASVDDNFGRLLAAVKELGIEDNTLVIFTSDNGPCAGSVTMDRYMGGLHGLKGTVYENGIRVPCFMRWPAGGLAGPAKVKRVAAHIDLLPTILHACGIKPPVDVKMDGVSLLPLLRNPTASWPDRTLFFQWDAAPVPRRGLACTAVSDKWKLVQAVGMDRPNQKHIRDRYAELCKAQGRGDRTMEGRPRWELYDIAADPGETKDLAAEHPEIVATMRKHYDSWYEDVCARWQQPDR